MPSLDVKIPFNYLQPNSFDPLRTKEKKLKQFSYLNYAGSFNKPLTANQKIGNSNKPFATTTPVFRENQGEKEFNSLLTILNDYNSDDNDFLRLENAELLPLVKRAKEDMEQFLGRSMRESEKLIVATGSECSNGNVPHVDKDFLATWFCSVSCTSKNKKNETTRYTNAFHQYRKTEKIPKEYHKIIMQDNKTIIVDYGYALITTSIKHNNGGVVHWAPTDCDENRQYIAVSIQS